jgi:hypothetical protein
LEKIGLCFIILIQDFEKLDYAGLSSGYEDLSCGYEKAVLVYVL